MRCRYNAVNFLTDIHKRDPIARPLGRGMGCLLWIKHLIDILPQFMQLFVQYRTILDRVITAQYYISIGQKYDIKTVLPEALSREGTSNYTHSVCGV